MEGKHEIDWESIEPVYCAGVMSLRAIGLRFGVSDAGILKRARKLGWVRNMPKRSGVPLEADKGREGFVYVIYLDDSAGNRFFKIGLSENFGDRFKTHQCASPFQMYVACSYFVPDMHGEERALHEMFSTQRVRGEWFQLSENDLVVIAERANLTNGR